MNWLYKGLLLLVVGSLSAAAASMLETAFGGEPPEPPEPVVFRADHPFLFLIRHRPTNSILFLGRYVSAPAPDASE